MPSHLKRYQQTGDTHFLTFSCHARQPYFNNPASRDLFERALEQTRRRYVFFVFGYVVMPEHIHLLVSEPKRSSLDRAIQSLKTSISKKSRQKPFWLPRYHDFNAQSRDKRIEKLRYLHRNPVVRGLVISPEEWRWSSFHHHMTGKEGTVEIESHWTSARRTAINLPASIKQAKVPRNP